MELQAFKKYDKDGDGMIDFLELGALMRGLAGSAAEWNDAAIKALLTAMDSDNDGKVVLSEFGAWLFGTQLSPAEESKLKTAEMTLGAKPKAKGKAKAKPKAKPEPDEGEEGEEGEGEDGEDGEDEEEDEGDDDEIDEEQRLQKSLSPSRIMLPTFQPPNLSSCVGQTASDKEPVGVESKTPEICGKSQEMLVAKLVLLVFRCRTT